VANESFHLPKAPPHVPKAVPAQSAIDPSVMAGAKRSAESMSDNEQQTTKRQKLDNSKQQADNGAAIDISDDEIEIL
jgi:hypothetical protein